MLETLPPCGGLLHGSSRSRSRADRFNGHGTVVAFGAAFCAPRLRRVHSWAHRLPSPRPVQSTLSAQRTPTRAAGPLG